MTDEALYFTAPETVEHRPVTVGSPTADELLVDTRVSAISAGTELLVYHDETPSGVPVDETIDGLDGEFTYPLKYGYAAAGVVTEVGDDVDPRWIGRTAFGFAPHQTRFCARPESVVALPDGMSLETGALLPSVETATNLVLDAAPRIGERAVVFGAGVIGQCVTETLASFPLAELTVVDPIEQRRELASEAGADRVVTPETVTDEVDDADLVVELSGDPTALDDAIDVVGYDGRIVVGSWYGSKREPIDLGGRFHRDRIDIVSSQVSTIDPELRGRWDRERRMEVTLDRLGQIDTERLVTDRIPFENAANAYERLDAAPDATMQVVLEY
ncbi:MAG: zinc-binding alcohol dehydrogenase [Halorubrum sp.]